MNRKDRNDPYFISQIPNDLLDFDRTDVDRAFTYMENKFCLSSKWREAYKSELRHTGRGISDEEFFFRFAKGKIEPALKIVLKRNDAVIDSMCRWLIADKIREKKREAEHLRSFYSGGQWKIEK